MMHSRPHCSSSLVMRKWSDQRSRKQGHLQLKPLILILILSYAGNALAIPRLALYDELAPSDVAHVWAGACCWINYELN
jgi:hypothetical protein